MILHRDNAASRTFVRKIETLKINVDGYCINSHAQDIVIFSACRPIPCGAVNERYTMQISMQISASGVMRRGNTVDKRLTGNSTVLLKKICARLPVLHRTVHAARSPQLCGHNAYRFLDTPTETDVAK